MKNPNKPKAKNNELTISEPEIKHISTSKDGIGMYAITFMVGQKKVAQTRHMTKAQAEKYQPRIEVVQSGGRTLQSCSFRADGKPIKGQQYSKYN